MATRVVRLLGLGVVMLALGCGDDEDILGPCEDCAGDCEVAEGFDFEGYEGSCGEGPELCPSAYEDGDCVQPDFDIVEATIADVHAALVDEAVTCEWLVYRHLERTLEHDLRVVGTSPPLNAFVTLNDQALETARRLDDYQRCEGELAGPLHCVPFAIKTNYGSKQVPTTNGSLALMDAQPDFDAFTVDRLRGAGAVLMGSTGMDEFAKGIAGISSRSGKVGNAYDTTRFSGGSSAGSAVATSAGFAMGGLGTDNCSSLTSPASYNGLVTIRSSFGLVSTEGIFPSNRLDVVSGPMTRTVEDLARFLDVMAQRNPADRAHCDSAPPRPDSFLDHLDADGLQGKRIGVLRDFSDRTDDWQRYPFAGASDEVEAVYDRFFDELGGLGAEIVDPIELVDFNDRRYGSGTGVDVDRFLASTSGGAEDFEAICDSEQYSQFVFSSKDQCLSTANQSKEQLEDNVASGRASYKLRRAYIEEFMEDRDLDALVYPTDPRGIARRNNHSANCLLSSVTGLPTITVHAGHGPGDMPVGMMLTGSMHADAELFEMAYAYEHAHPYRRAPELADVEDPSGVDVDTLNDLHLAIGQEAFERVLKDGGKYDLTSSVFTGIVRDVLTDAGWEALSD